MSHTVMISSTARDLPDHRRAAEDACMGLGIHPVMMEDLPALDADAIDASLQMVDDSTVYLGIYAQRYGYVPVDAAKNPTGISITEMEYNRAVDLGRPRLLFVAADDHTPALDTEPGDGAAKLARFKERVLKERVVKFFRSPDELRAHITQALAHWLHFQVTWHPIPPPDDDTIPDPAPLPPGSRVLVGRYTHFVGREDTLRSLAQTLLRTNGDGGAAGGVGVVITAAAAATGAGGIGKTQVAVEFAHRYGRCFYGVHWIDMRGVEPANVDSQFSAEVAACGLMMNLPGFPPDDQPTQARLTLETWAQTPPRLVILDNAESPAAIHAVRHHLPGARLLVTSRWGEDQDWTNIDVIPCGLDTLTRDQSLDLLRKLAPHLESVPDADLDALAKRLGDFPLALDLAGRYLHSMRRAGLTVADFRARLETENPLDHPALRAWAAQTRQTNPTKHDMDVAATFLASWEKVDDPAAARLFRACGYLAPNHPLPPDLLRELVKSRPQGLLNRFKRLFRSQAKGVTKTEEETLADTLAQLVQYGLLRPAAADETALAIHSLLADFARGLGAGADANTGDDRPLAALADALARLTKAANDTGLPAHFVPLRPHVEIAAGHAETAGVEDAGALWNNLGYHLWMIADLEGARGAFERALGIWEHVLGPDHPNVASAVNNLGGVLQDLGDLAGARVAFERALAIDESVYGPDHPNVAIRVNTLGGVLQDLGDLAGARVAYERALAIDEAVYGPDHPNVATDVNNLGSVLQDLGDLAGARVAYERALAIDERIFGPDHPKVAIRVNNLGLVLQDLGDLPGARVAFERALAIWEQALGLEHPNVATAVNNRGGVLRALGDLAGARAAYERALTIDESVYGPDHPEVATDVNNLGHLRLDEGDRAGARADFERALRILEQFLPPEHPNIQRVRRNLAALGDVEG